MMPGDGSTGQLTVARVSLAVLLFLVLYVPFAEKPVHIDDANFLILSEGAARAPWRPHDIPINWSGTTESAFDILANPPGIAWYLAPVRTASERVMHLWMLPWLALSAWGCWRLGMHFANGAGYFAALYVLTCPVVVISAHALTPDLPVFACMSAGVGGFVTSSRRRPFFALLAGCAALFRYSGCTVIPLLLLAGWLRQGWRGALMGLLSAVPIMALVLHDLDAYGRIHLLVMVASQNDPESRPVQIAVHNTVAGVAMLGGAGVLPVLVWRVASAVGALIGAAVGVFVSWLTGLSLVETIPTVLALASGAAALSLALASKTRDPILSAWSLGGAAFFLFVKFAATRYWAAFVPGVAMLALRNARSSSRWLMVGIVVNALLSFGIALDDQFVAQGYQEAAKRVAALGTGTFSGHWGFQHYLAKEGWVPLERGGQPGALHAYATFGDAQQPDPAACLTFVERIPLPDPWKGPRVYSWFHHVFYHAGGRGQYTPWTFSDEPYDVITVFRRCDADDQPTTPAPEAAAQ